MALVDTITRVQAKGNDIQRRLMMRPGQRCILLKRGKETSRFVVVEELEAGWNLRFNEYRDQFVLEIAYVEADVDNPVFGNVIGQTSHVACGVPYTANSSEFLDLFVTDPERRDIKPPTVDSPFWKVYLTRAGTERYVLPPPPPEWVVNRNLGNTFITATLGDTALGVGSGDFTVADVGRRITVDNGGILIDAVVVTVVTSTDVIVDTPHTSAPFFGEVTVWDPA